MAGVKAATLQYVLNSTPLEGWIVAFGLDASFLFGVIGGPTPKSGNFQINAKTSGNTTAGSFAESDTLTTAGSQARDRVTLNQRRYYATVAVDGLVEAKAAGAAYDQLTDILLDEVSDAVEDIFDAMNSDCITSGSANDIDGVPYYNATGSGLAPGTGLNTKFGDKTRAGYYSSAVTFASSSALAFSHLDGAHKELVDVRKSNYDQIWTSETQLLAYEELLRVSGSSVHYVDAQVGDRRFKALLYSGRPLIAIPGYDNSRIDFVRSTDWMFWNVPQVSLDETGRKIEGIFKVEQLAKTTDDTTFTVITYGNLICKNPYKQAAIVDLA